MKTNENLKQFSVEVFLFETDENPFLLYVTPSWEEVTRFVQLFHKDVMVLVNGRKFDTIDSFADIIREELKK